MEYIIKEKFRDDPTSTSITNLDYSSYMDANGGLGMGGMNNMGSTASLNYGSFDGTAPKGCILFSFLSLKFSFV